MTLNKFLKGVALAGVFSVFAVPFLVSNELFFPFITSKAFFFRVIIEIAFASWLILSLRDESMRPRKSMLLWSFLAFMIAIGLADIFGMNPWKSFWSNFERMEGYVSLLHLFMYFLVASSVLSTEKMWKRFLELSVWSSVLIAIYGILQLSGKIPINQGGVRVDATFGNATYLAIYLIFNIFFALVLIVKENVLWKRMVYGLIAVIHFIILYYTGTRGSMLGLLGGLMLSALIIAIFDRGESKKRIIAGSVVGAIIVLIFTFIAIKDTQFVRESPVLERFASISWKETKTQARAYIWPMAVQGFKENPVLGWGQENFNYIFNAKYDPRMYAQEQWFDHAHNTVLDWLVAGGLLGLLTYLSLFASTLYLIWRKSVDMTFTEKSLFTGLLAGYFFHNLFVFDNIMSYILFMSVMAMSQWKSTRLTKPIGASVEEGEETDMRIFAPVVLVVLVFAVYFFNFRAYETNKSLIVALRALSVNPVQAEVAVMAFQKAVSYDTLGRQEVMERLVESVKSINTSNVSLGIREKFASMTTKAVETQVDRSSGDARYELFAANFYYQYGEAQRAEEHFLKAATLSPTKQSILIQLANFYLGQGKQDEAIKIFKQAYDLDHSYTDAAIYYSMALIYSGKESQATEFLKSAGLESLTDDVRIQAYIAMSKWREAIPILQRKVLENPGETKYWENLTRAYYESGDKTSAIRTLREAVVANPALKTQAEAMIKNIESGIK